MELEAREIRYQYKSKKLLSGVSFKVSSENIIGIIGEYKTLLLEILDLEKEFTGKIFVDGELITRENKLKYQRQIALVHQDNSFYMNKVEDEMKFVVDFCHYTSKDLQKRMKDALKMVGLAPEYLKREFKTLSNSEKTLVKVACSILTNPKILIFDETFIGLDNNQKKMLLKLCRKLKERKDKLIIITSHDVDFLYQFTDELIILENGKVLRQDNTQKIMQNESFLREHQIEVPYLVQFTNLAKKRKVKLSYHKDILDLIKDVYKHV